MSGSMTSDRQIPFRNRSKPVKKWSRSEELTLIKYLKENRDFEKPISRIYYNTFLAESGIDGDFKTVRSKVRNMRTSYRKAKEFEINKLKSNDLNLDVEAVRSEMLKMCWYVDDFDDLFPNEMDGYIDKSISMPNFEDDFSNQEEFFSNTHNENDTNNTTFNENITLKNESSSSSSSNSIDEDIFTVRKDLFNLKRHSKDTSIRQQELELFKEKLNFEKEKFRQEIRLKAREIESQERVKIMELQMKERIAMKELELKEKLALKSMEKQETTYNNVYHDMT